jgi:drug/metabolite transporter (DMT)-like permease
MAGIVLALGAAFGWGIADYLGGSASRRVATIVVLTVSQAIGLALAVTAAVTVGLGDPVGADLLYAAGAGVALSLGLGALYRAMAIGAMAIASPIAATGTVIPVAVGLAAGDRPSGVQVGGAAAAMVGVALCAWSPGPSGLTGGYVARGVGLAVLAAIGGGLTATALSAASSAGVIWVLLVQRATVVGVGLAILIRAGAAERPPRSAMPAIAAIGVLDLVATGLFTLAAAHGPLSLVAVVGALYPVVTVALAYVVLSERLAAHQAAGALAAMAGVAAIAGG